MNAALTSNKTSHSTPGMSALARYEAAPGVWLDARRALWYAPEEVLAVADLHLGYAWAQRHAGMLLPVTTPDDTLDRLAELQREYRPKQLVVLGDVVQRAVEVPTLRAELERLGDTIGPDCRLRLLLGNHDRKLENLVGSSRRPIALEHQAQIGPHLLLHGDRAPSAAASGIGSLTIIGHEHPALRLGDGVTSSAKCPCFVVGARVLILPAFSNWAAGSVVGSGFMSAIARGERFTKAVAILNGKLLPVPL